MRKSEVKAIMEEIKRLKEENEKLKKAVKGAGSEEPEWEIVERRIVKEGDRPKAYALIQKKGRRKRVVIGGYTTIPEKQVKEVKDYYIKTSWKDRKGKKVKGYFVPRKKGCVALTKKEIGQLLKGF